MSLSSVCKPLQTSTCACRCKLSRTSRAVGISQRPHAPIKTLLQTKSWTKPHKTLQVSAASKQQAPRSVKKQLPPSKFGKRKGKTSGSDAPDTSDKKWSLSNIIGNKKKEPEPPAKAKQWSLLNILSRRKEPEVPAPEPAWNILDWQAYNQAWQVPWGRKELAIGLFGWASSFVAVGIALVPLIGIAIGVQDFKSLTSSDKSFYALINQILETVVGIAVINAAVSKAGPLDDDLFKLDIRKPFTKPDGWLFWGLIGVLAAPVVVGICAAIISTTGYEDLVQDKSGTVDGVAQILSTDVGAFLNLFAVTAILAPLLEETVFRGFLLTTLTKFMPTWTAVLISSFGFGAAHASAGDLPQLTALGALLGFTYVRSRNLLTPMLIHGAWNGTVLVILFTLASSGIDLQEALTTASDETAGFIKGPWLLH